MKKILEQQAEEQSRLEAENLERAERAKREAAAEAKKQAASKQHAPKTGSNPAPVPDSEQPAENSNERAQAVADTGESEQQADLQDTSAKGASDEESANSEDRTNSDNEDILEDTR